MRVADEFRIFTNVNSCIVDPKNFDSKSFVEFKGDVCIVPPNSFALGRSVEYFRIPRNVLTLCVGKSTYARCGIIVNVTPFEPEWEGFVTLEISNTTPVSYTHLDVYKRQELDFLRRFDGTDENNNTISSAAVRRMPGGEAAAERFVRRGHLAAREMVHRRKTRTQKIVAWNPAKEEAGANAAEGKIREVLTATRGCLLYTSRCV